jgi:hypothetical protein
LRAQGRDPQFRMSVSKFTLALRTYSRRKSFGVRAASQPALTLGRVSQSDQCVHSGR